MFVTQSEVSGSIGGGQLELEAINAARQLLQTNQLPATLDFPLGEKLGQCCGGAVQLGFSLLTQGELRAIEADLSKARKTLLLFGAGHVARALVTVLQTLPVEIQWIETRDNVTGLASVFPETLPLNVQCLQTDLPESELESAPQGASVLVMTHSHRLDESLIAAALKRNDWAYLGLIGSQTKRKKFEQRFAQKNNANNFAQLVCPIGLPTIQGKAPEIIALSVAAQLAQVWGW